MSEKLNASKTPAITRRQFAGRTAMGTLALGLTASSASRVLGANDRINVGAIGCGSRGTSHLRLLTNFKDQQVKITALCDIYKPRLMRAKDITAADFVTQEHEELLARQDVDVVLIATPEHWHGYQTIDAVRAGKDVYCEKPFTHWRQLGLAEQAACEADEAQRIVVVGCQRMSSTAYSQAKALIQKGIIGKPVMAETGYFRFGDWGERGMPIDDPDAKPGPDLSWERFLGDCPRQEFDVSRFFRWRMYWDTAGGPVSDNYVHFYNPLAYVLDLGYPDKVTGTGGKLRYQEREVPDTCNLIIDYPNDFTVTCVGTQANAYTTYGSNETPVIRGWDGTLLIGETELQVLHSETGALLHREEVSRGPDTLFLWQELFECCRTRKQPLSNARLSAPVNTTMQMGILAVRGERVVRYDHEKGSILA
jgi:predicted dehydrogenase